MGACVVNLVNSIIINKFFLVTFKLLMKHLSADKLPTWTLVLKAYYVLFVTRCCAHLFDHKHNAVEIPHALRLVSF